MRPWFSAICRAGAPAHTKAAASRNLRSEVRAPAANQADGPRISMDDSRVSAWVIPTDEEGMIARHTAALLGGGS